MEDNSNINEIWVDITGFEGIYQISNFGSLRSLDRFVSGKFNSKRRQFGKIQKPCKTKKGYLTYSLSISKGNYIKKLAHVLVATYFVENPENKPQVNHKDCVKDNNHYLNLEWVTGSENVQHAIKNGKFKFISKNKGKTFIGQRIIVKNFNGDFVGEFKSIREASKETKVSVATISRFINGKVSKNRSFIYEKAPT